jgi:hypothetical protein
MSSRLFERELRVSDGSESVVLVEVEAGVRGGVRGSADFEVLEAASVSIDSMFGRDEGFGNFTVLMLSGTYLEKPGATQRWLRAGDWTRRS